MLQDVNTSGSSKKIFDITKYKGLYIPDSPNKRLYKLLHKSYFDLIKNDSYVVSQSYEYLTAYSAENVINIISEVKPTFAENFYHCKPFSNYLSDDERFIGFSDSVILDKLENEMPGLTISNMISIYEGKQSLINFFKIIFNICTKFKPMLDELYKQKNTYVIINQNICSPYCLDGYLEMQVFLLQKMFNECIPGYNFFTSIDKFWLLIFQSTSPVNLSAARGQRKTGKKLSVAALESKVSLPLFWSISTLPLRLVNPGNEYLAKGSRLKCKKSALRAYFCSASPLVCQVSCRLLSLPCGAVSSIALEAVSGKVKYGVSLFRVSS
jgi:hypothetical protein